LGDKPPTDRVVRDAIGEHGGGKYVGWIMGLQRETYEPSRPKEVEIQVLAANSAPNHINVPCP
jgi:hypothetical protein